MPNTNKEKKNQTNLEYYHRNKEKICEKQKTKSKEYYDLNKEKKLDTQKRWRLNNPEKNIWHRTQQRCKRTGHLFEIVPEDIIIPTYCPILGIKLEIGGDNKDTSPSIDRIDNSKGYIKDNIQIISLRANRIKSDATIQELQKLVDYLMDLNK